MRTRFLLGGFNKNGVISLGICIQPRQQAEALSVNMPLAVGKKCPITALAARTHSSNIAASALFTCGQRMINTQDERVGAIYFFLIKPTLVGQKT